MSGARVRVLHIVNNLNFGGMERIIAEIVRRTDRERFETHVLVLQYLGHFSQGLDQYAGLHVAGPQTRLSLVRPQTLARDIAAIAPDVVHTHSGIWYKASRAARMAGVPYLIHTDHGRPNPDTWSNELVDKLASRRTDVVVPVSEALAAHLRRFVAHPDRLQVIPNGVDTGMYAPGAADGALRAELNIPADTPILGSVGRLQPVKGYDVMVAAFAALRDAWPADAGPLPVLVLIGDGRERERLEADARAGGVADGIRFCGWRSDIAESLAQFTLFTMSSRSEGTSVSLLEAMSSGLCPVVTDVGGNAAVLGPDLRHRLVPPLDPGALAAAWRDALRDVARRAADAHAARARVIDVFSLDMMVRRYEALYTQGAARGVARA